MAWGLALFAWMVSALLVDRLCQPGSSLHILDEPNHRSLHHNPKPHTGGVAIVIAIYLSTALLSLFMAPPLPLTELAISGLIIATASFLDDCVELKARWRLLAHFSAVTLTVLAFLTLESFELPGWTWYWSKAAAVILVTLFITWMLNLYNFMDGMDGFVSGMTLIGLGTFALMGWRAGDEAFVAVCAIGMGATLGFWVFNYPPSYIFMGDVGACSLGFFVAVIGLWGCEAGIFKPWFALLVFSPFIVDATTTLFLRVGRLEKVWLPQRNHFYHRILLRLGHRKALWCEYTLMIACALSALYLTDQSVIVQQWALAAWALIYLALGLVVTRFEKTHDILERL